LPAARHRIDSTCMIGSTFMPSQGLCAPARIARPVKRDMSN
jgi:hypothetical protein